MCASYATHVFYPPSTITSRNVNQNAKNHPTSGFRTIHFHRLAYTDSQTSSALAGDVADELTSFSDDLHGAVEGETKAGNEKVEIEPDNSIDRSRHLPGRDYSQIRAYRSLAGEDTRRPLEDNLIAVQTGRSASDGEDPQGQLTDSIKSFSQKKRPSKDVVPDSTRKGITNWPNMLDYRRLTFSEGVLDTPEQTVPRFPPRHLPASPSTPLGRPLRSEPVLLANDTNPRPRKVSKLAKSHTVILDTPNQNRVSEEEKSAIWLERLHSLRTGSRFGLMGNTIADTPIPNASNGESSRSKSLVSVSATAKFVTSTQRDDLGVGDRDFFQLGNESGIEWPAPIMPRSKTTQLDRPSGMDERPISQAERSFSTRRSPIAEDRARAKSPQHAEHLPISFSTDGSRSAPQRADKTASQREDNSTFNESASLAPDSATRPATGMDWSESWEMTPTGGKRSKRLRTQRSGNLNVADVSRSGWMSTRKEQSISQGQSAWFCNSIDSLADLLRCIGLLGARPTGSTDSDMFSQTMNPTGKTGSGLFTSQSQSICTFPSYLAIPANSLTDLTELLNMPPDGESRRVDLLAVVWEVGAIERFSNKCEVQLCQPIGNGRADDSAGWGTRKTLLRVEFWDEYADDVKRLKSGDVVWIKSEHIMGFSGPFRYMVIGSR